MRLVSLVPSLSKTVCDLGLQDRIVGCTNFCVSPTNLYKTAAAVGGTKDPDLEKVAELQPTHILVNDEENTPEIIAACRAIAPTITTAPVLPEDSATLVRTLGRELDCPQAAESLAIRLDHLLEQIRARMAERTRHAQAEPASFVYLIWREPYMAAGRDTYLSHAVSLLGWQNALLSGERYPTLSVEELGKMQPTNVLFTSEPYPFRKRHIKVFAEEVGQRSQYYQADGQLFTWWGSMAETMFAQVLKFWEGQPCDIIKPVQWPATS